MINAKRRTDASIFEAAFFLNFGCAYYNIQLGVPYKKTGECRVCSYVFYPLACNLGREGIFSCAGK